MRGYFKELKHIEKQKTNPVYLLHGDDIFLKQEFVRTLFIAGPEAEKKIYYGNQGKNEDVDFLDSLVSFGLFATKKIIVYYEIEKLNTKYRGKILKYVTNPDKNTVLVLIAEKNNQKFIKDIMKYTKYLKVWTPFPENYVEFVQEQINRMGFDVTVEAVNQLVSMTSDSLHHTFSEFEKVIINTGYHRKITSDDVKNIVGGEKKYSMYDFVDAIGNKNFYKAIDICDVLAQMGTKAPYFIISLFSFFTDMYVCFSEDVNQMFSYNWKRKKQIVKSIGKYRDSDFRKIFSALHDVDIKGKSTGLSTQELIVPLIYEIIQA